MRDLSNPIRREILKRADGRPVTRQKISEVAVISKQADEGHNALDRE
jgi:hypothetical protein